MVGSNNVAVGGATVSVGTGVSVGNANVGELWFAVGVSVELQAARNTEIIIRIIKRFIASNLIS
jgi:hypothetical protein